MTFLKEVAVILKYLSERPMLLSAIICCFISVAAFYSAALLLIIGITLSLLLGFLVIRRGRATVIFGVAMALIMLLSALFACGKVQRLSLYGGVKSKCELIVCDITYESSEYCVADIEIQSSATVPRGTRASVYFSGTSLSMGQAVKASVELEEVKDKYKADSFSNGIFLGGRMSDIEEAEDKNDYILSAVGRVKSYIKDTLFANMDYNEAATMCALLFGDRSYFSDEFYGNVKAAGVSHIMVVSGLHLAIIVTLFTKITEKIVYNRYLRALIMLTVVLLLTALCGFTMSMLRAGVTYALIALSLMLNRQHTPENTLGAATVLILISSPFAIFSIAFQLSLLSTLGILAVALPIIDYVEANELISKKAVLEVFSSVLVTVSATVLTLPVAIYVFGYVSVVSIIANLLISNAVTAAIWLAITALMANLVWGFGAEMLLFVCGWLVKYINGVINYFGSLPFATAILPQNAAFIAVLLIIIIFWILLACKSRRDMVKLKKMHSKKIKEGGKR